MNVNENIKIDINFSGLEDIYVGSSKEFALILKKIQQEYLKYIELFEEQIQSENIEEFRKTRHKISATLLLLKLDNLLEYITFLKEHFSSGFQEKEEAIITLRKCFGEVQEGLAEKLKRIS